MDGCWTPARVNKEGEREIGASSSSSCSSSSASLDGGGRNRRGIDLGLSVDGGVRSGGSPRRRIGGGGLSSPFNPELEKEIERRRIASVVTLASPIS